MQRLDKFLDTLKSPHTKKMYQYHWDKFIKSNPPTLIQRNARKLEEYIGDYLHDMRLQGVSFSYANVSFSAIKHHLVMKERLILGWERIAKALGESEAKNNLEGYSKEQIQKLLGVCDVKYKAIVLLLSSSGIRREALVELKLEDIEYLDEYKLYKLKVYRRSKWEYTTFTTPEAAEAVKYYIDQYKPKLWLFPSRFSEDEHMGTSVVSGMIRKLNLTLGIGSAKSHSTSFRSGIPSVHGLRHFTISQMKKAKVDLEIAKLLTGHSIGIRRGYLSKYDDNDLLQDYLPAIKFLTINETEQLQEKVKDLEDEKDKRISELESKIAELENKVLGQKSDLRTLDFFATILSKIRMGGFKGTDSEGVQMIADFLVKAGVADRKK